MNLKRRDRAYENARRGPFRAAERPVLEGLDPLELFVRQTLDPEADDPGGNEEIVHLEDLTQEELDRLDRFLDIPPAEKGSGLSDISINHDKYLAEDG